ncbi:MAG: hypothetical protein WC080_02900 [Patescibacteria group bacterium]
MQIATGINVFAGALVSLAGVQIDSLMPNFAAEPEFVRLIAEKFDIDRLSTMDVQLPSKPTWLDVRKVLRSTALACLINKDADVRPYYGDRIHCPEGVDPSDIYFYV